MGTKSEPSKELQPDFTGPLIERKTVVVMNAVKKEYYRPAEIEQAFGIPAITARYYFHAGILKGAKIGSIILINGDDLRARLAHVEIEQTRDEQERQNA